MNHSENRLEIAKRLAALVAMTVPLPKQLRPYQVETIAAMIRWLEDPKGSRRAYVSHATGLGKTTIFASMITACAGLRILVVVPSKILIEQTARELYTFTRGMIGHVSSLKNIEDENGEIISIKGHELFDVVLITDASMAKHGFRLAKEFDPHLVIRDECHWTYAEKRQKTMDFFPESVTIGFSATPDYLTNQARNNFVPVTLDNGQVLYAPEDRLARNHYGTCLDERTVRWGIEEGFLAPLAWGHVEFDFSLDGLRTAQGKDGPDYKEEDLLALLSQKWQFMQETVVELYKSGQYGLAQRQVFAVCHSVQAAEMMAEALRRIGVSAACITGKTRDTERNAVLSSFRDGGIKFLSSVMVLREGWNAPNAEVCLMLRPTKSRVFYVQSMGRVLRPSGDGSYKVALVIDALYQNTQFSPLSAPVLFGYPGQELGDGDLLIHERGDASKVKESPYKTGIVKPRLIKIEALTYGPKAGILISDPLVEETYAQAVELAKTRTGPEPSVADLAILVQRLKEGGQSQAEIAKRLSRSQAYISRLLKLRSGLVAEAFELLSSGVLVIDNALRFSDLAADKQRQATERIRKKLANGDKQGAVLAINEACGRAQRLTVGKLRRQRTFLAKSKKMGGEQGQRAALAEAVLAWALGDAPWPSELPELENKKT
jgi:superfamily II DNA or RNA helicase/transcriptional regulator with XRE-family HTH domain